MKLYVAPQAFIDMRLFIGGAKRTEESQHVEEISWLGAVEPYGSDVYLSEVFLVKQECSAAHTTMSGDALSDMLIELIGQGRDDVIPKLNFWGHSHAGMAAYFSGTDTDTIGEWMGPWLVALVMNLKGEYEARLDVFQPFRLSTQLDLEIAAFPTAADRERVKAAIAEHVSFPVHQYSHGGYGAGKVWDRDSQTWKDPKALPQGSKPKGQEALSGIKWRVGQQQVGRRRMSHSTSPGVATSWNEYFYIDSGQALNASQLRELHTSNDKAWAQAQWVFNTREDSQGKNPYNFLSDEIHRFTTSEGQLLNEAGLPFPQDTDDVLDFDDLAELYGYEPLGSDLGAEGDLRERLKELLAVESSVMKDAETSIGEPEDPTLTVLEERISADIDTLYAALKDEDSDHGVFIVSIEEGGA